MGDKAYNRNPLDAEGAMLGREMIAPQRAGTCLFAWIQNARRPSTRGERKIADFLTWLRLAARLMLERTLYEMSSRPIFRAFCLSSSSSPPRP